MPGRLSRNSTCTIPGMVLEDASLGRRWCLGSRSVGSFRVEPPVAFSHRVHISEREWLSPNLRGTFFSYRPTPSLRRNVIIGHQFVNPDCNRFRPTKAVKRYQYGLT